MSLFGIKLSKGVDGLANEYIGGLPEDAACNNPGSALNISKADFDQNIIDLTDACVSYVVNNRTGASSSKAKTTCKAKLQDKMKCSIEAQQAASKTQDDTITSQLGKINYWPYLIAFLFVGIIFYLLTSPE